MRPLRFGIVALLLVFAYCGAIAVRNFIRTPTPAPNRPAYPVTDSDVSRTKSNLCRMAQAERAFYAATGRFAEKSELRADADGMVPPNELSPYLFSIHVPAADRFVIVAHAYGPLQKQPPALVVDDRLQICTVRSDLPNTVWQLDDPPRRWRRTSYPCETCR